MAYVGKKNQALSKAACSTDYLTFVRTVKEYQKTYGLKVTPEIKATAARLKAQRYDYHGIQTSDFFLRIRLERDEDMIQRALREVHHTAKRIMERSEEHTSELQSLMRISYAVFCLKKKTNNTTAPNQE